jgi:hypothetical protein
MKARRTALSAALAVSLAANLALLARQASGTRPPQSTVESRIEPPSRTRPAFPVPPGTRPPRLATDDCANQRATGETALAAIRRDIERFTPPEAKWERARANPALTGTISAGVAAARPEVPAEEFAVDCRDRICRLTATTQESFDRLIDTPYVRRISEKHRWGDRSLMFEARPEDSVDGLGYLRSVSAEVEAEQRLAPCGDAGGSRRLRVPVRLTVTDGSESLDRSGIDLMVGTLVGHLEVTACVQRILRAHFESLALPTNLSAATFYTYFYLAKR